MISRFKIFKKYFSNIETPLTHMNKEQGNNSRLLYLPCKQIEVHKIMIDLKVSKNVKFAMYILRSLTPEKLKRK